MKHSLVTEFAPPERSPRAEIDEQHLRLQSNLRLDMLGTYLPLMVLVLNRNRQIVFTNPLVLKMVDKPSPNLILGLRPGELLDCTHSSEMEAGCGTTRFCSVCGAVKAILSGLRGQEDIEECRITRKNGDALDLRVWAFPLAYGNEPYTLFFMDDISNEKRRRILERIFFHDIMNTVSGLIGFSDLLKIASPEELKATRIADEIELLSNRLVEEISAQKQLLAAENNELKPALEPLDSGVVLAETVALFRNLDVAEGKFITIDPGSSALVLKSDKALLSRVIGNMVKNALEASEPGDTVTLGCQGVGRELQFWVHNRTFMPPEVQLQIFQRSFTTKGAGRGIGTYSMKLLTERYLGGSISFTSTPEAGTRFMMRLPGSSPALA